jgi:hypothetical protein
MVNRNRKTNSSSAGTAGVAGEWVRWILPGVGLAWLSLVLARYWIKFPNASAPWGPLLDAVTETRLMTIVSHGGALALTAGTLFAGAGLGHLVLRYWAGTWSSALERVAVTLGLGQGLLAMGVFVLGVIQAYRPWVFWAAFAGILVLAVHQWQFAGMGTLIAQAQKEWAEAHRSARSVTVFRVFIVLFGALTLLLAFSPEIFYDAQVYHLGVPRWYLLEGGIRYYPAIHAQFPFLRQMLNLWGMALHGDSLAKLLHVASVGILWTTFHALARGRAENGTPTIATALFVAMPMVGLNLWSASVDAGMACFALLAVLGGVRLWETGEKAWALLTGIFLGLVFSCKYTGGVVTGWSIGDP